MAISGRQCSSYKLSLKWCAPIASVAALTAQPLAALPPYGCGVPLAGTERLWQLQISGCSADRTRRCRGGACPARRCTNDSYRLSLKWQALPNCHCEAPTGPWRPEREARGSALGVQSRSAWLDNRVLPAKTQLPTRDRRVRWCGSGSVLFCG